MMSQQVPQISEHKVEVDGQVYPVQVLIRTSLPFNAFRLLVISYLPNPMAVKVLRTCLEAIQRYTPEPHELWVVDNHSPHQNNRWLLEYPEVNVILNQLEPIPATQRRFCHRWRLFQRQQQWGSYANAIGLELGVRLIDPRTCYLMTLHMDTLPCQSGWLSYVHSKLNDAVRSAGVHLQKNRFPEGVLHVLGHLMDFQLFRQLQLDFMPELPRLDVGDRVTLGVRQAGYQVFACRDTYNEPDLVEKIPPSPFKDFQVLRALNDENQVIFMHLGRGVRKTTGEHRRGVTADEWIHFAQKHLLY